MRADRRSALTLYELLVVLAILVVLAAIVVPLLSQSVHSAELDATYATMVNLRNAIMGSGGQPGYYQDMRGVLIGGIPDKGLPQHMSLVGGVYQRGTIDLFVNPGAPPFDPYTKKGWRGPYLSTGPGATQAGLVLDSFPTASQSGSPIWIYWGDASVTNSAGVPEYVFLVSFGADGKPDIDYTTHYKPSDIQAQHSRDDLVLFLQPTPDDTPPSAAPWTNYYDLKQRSGGR